MIASMGAATASSSSSAVGGGVGSSEKAMGVSLSHQDRLDEEDDKEEEAAAKGKQRSSRLSDGSVTTTAAMDFRPPDHPGDALLVRHTIAKNRHTCETVC